MSEIGCEICGKLCKGLRGLGVHAAHAHGKRVCVKCGMEKRRTTNGARWRCPSCAANRMRVWRGLNPDKAREIQRVRYHANPERARELREAWRRANPERLRQLKLAWYARNPEKARGWSQAWRAANAGTVQQTKRQWYEANAEQQRQYSRLWKKGNREKARAQNRRYRARRARSPFYPVPEEKLRQRVGLWGNRCWVCQGPAEQIDHVKPLSKGGMEIASNLRPICRGCNCGKGVTWPLGDWLWAFRKQLLVVGQDAEAAG